MEPRYRRAFSQRRLTTRLDLDGMGQLWATTTAMDLAAIDVRLTRKAEALGAEDPRTLEQRRVDLFVDLLLGRTSHGLPGRAVQAAPSTEGSAPAPVVGITVPLQSLLDLDATPAVVNGSGAPVPASVARDVLSRPGTLVYRLLTDPAGDLLDVCQLGRFPTAKLGFAVDARDQTCRFPTCTRPALLCDADHTKPHPDGPTAYRNLGLLCRRHHRMKTRGVASLSHAEPGVFEWTMPTGSIHTVRPEPQPAGDWPAEPDEPEEPPPDVTPAA